MPRKSVEKDKIRRIAWDRIKYLMGLADEAASVGRLDMANDYVKQARQLGMHHNVRLPAEYKRKFCRFCYNYLKPTISSKVRINSARGRVEIRCLNCGRVTLFPYGREKKERRRKRDEERKQQPRDSDR